VISLQGSQLRQGSEHYFATRTAHASYGVIEQLSDRSVSPIYWKGSRSRVNIVKNCWLRTVHAKIAFHTARVAIN
jgi:hypothetical protein